MAGPNAEMIDYWSRGAGPAWVAQQERLDRQLLDLGARTAERAAVAPRERVLDVGCGCGGSTLELAARVGEGGRVAGVDVSAPMLARARERARAAALADRVAWILGDAQVLELGERRFDCLYSRFGVMFFDDPVAAFRNLGRALRPGGRLAFACWQARDRNPWMTAPVLAAAPYLELPPPPPPDAPGPFAFADPERVRSILEAAEFRDVGFEAVDAPLSLGGGDLEEAVDLFLAVGPLGALLREQGVPPDRRERVVDAVRRALEGFQSDAGLRAPSAAWIVTARI